MTHVFIADALPSARTALGLLLQDLKMRIVGEAADWNTTLDVVPTTDADMLIVAWELLPPLAPSALAALRVLCPHIIIVLLSHLDAREQATRSVGADVFISKSETPDRVAERLRAAVEHVRPK